MSMRFQGKKALVTGAARGIGAAIARRLLSEGAEVLAVDKAAFNAAEAFGEHAGKATALTVDLGAADATEQLLAAVRENSGGKLDFLINNAGIGGAKTLAETSEEDWDRFILVNLTSVYRICRALLPTLAKPGGRIVNIASVFGLTAFPGSLAYSVSKAGVAQLTRQIAVDLAPEGILVNGIAPGIIETEMTRKRIERDAWYKVVMCDATPIGRNGTPDDIAGVAAFLCSADAAFMTGQVLVVDGGWLESKYLPKTTAA